MSEGQSSSGATGGGVIDFKHTTPLDPSSGRFSVQSEIETTLESVLKLGDDGQYRLGPDVLLLGPISKADLDENITYAGDTFVSRIKRRGYGLWPQWEDAPDNVKTGFDVATFDKLVSESDMWSGNPQYVSLTGSKKSREKCERSGPGSKFKVHQFICVARLNNQ